MIALPKCYEIPSFFRRIPEAFGSKTALNLFKLLILSELLLVELILPKLGHAGDQQQDYKSSNDDGQPSFGLRLKRSDAGCNIRSKGGKGNQKRWGVPFWNLESHSPKARNRLTKRQ